MGKGGHKGNRLQGKVKWDGKGWASRKQIARKNIMVFEGVGIKEIDCKEK